MPALSTKWHRILLKSWGQIGYYLDWFLRKCSVPQNGDLNGQNEVFIGCCCTLSRGKPIKWVTWSFWAAKAIGAGWFPDGVGIHSNWPGSCWTLIFWDVGKAIESNIRKLTICMGGMKAWTYEWFIIALLKSSHCFFEFDMIAMTWFRIPSKCRSIQNKPIFLMLCKTSYQLAKGRLAKWDGRKMGCIQLKFAASRGLTSSTEGHGSSVLLSHSKVRVVLGYTPKWPIF